MTYKPGPATFRVINGLGYVTSTPIPLHTAVIRLAAGHMWVVRMISLAFDPIVGRYGSLDDARQGAGRAVNQRALHDMKSIFTGMQRKAMGQQQCPYVFAGRLCLAQAAGFSVWCPDHPKGRLSSVEG